MSLQEAAGATLYGIVQSNIKKVSPDARQWISAIVGSVAGEFVGESAQTGASTAVSAIRNNDFSDNLSGAWDALKDKGTGTLEGIKEVVTNPSIFFDAVEAVCQDPTLLIDGFVGEIPENYYKLEEAIENEDDYAAGYYATALVYDVALNATEAAGVVKTTSSLSRLIQISKAEAAISMFKNIDEGLNFTKTTLNRMENTGRYVPVEILRDAIKTTEAFPDPMGSSAEMHYITMVRNGKTYNLEVLYDSSSNTVYHFQYTQKAIGNLSAIE